VNIDEFRPEAFERGGKYALYLRLTGPASEVTMPVLLVRGHEGGSTLVATAGVHGDEYEGVRAIYDVYTRLDPSAMSGDFLAVPVSNPPAFWNASRTSPLDGGNLARVFPGSLEAGVTEAIAYWIANAIISRADLYIDLHSGGISWLYPTMIGYDARDTRSAAAARAFGTKILWAHPNMSPGRSVTFASERGIPWLYTEARGAGRIDAGDLVTFVRGVLNLFYYLNILKGVPEVTPIDCHLYGDGDLDDTLMAGQAGFLVTDCGLLQAVCAGEPLGRLCDLLGETLEVYRAPMDGVIAVVRALPVVQRGDPVFIVTGVLPESAQQGLDR